MNPRLFIETPRLLLRLPHPEDVRNIHGAVVAGLPRLARWIPAAAKGQTQRQTRDMVYINMALWVQDAGYFFGMFLQDSGLCVGQLELSPRDPSGPEYEFGFWVRPDFWGQGIASEAVATVRDYALTNLRAGRLYMRVAADNAAGLGVARVCGFVAVEEGPDGMVLLVCSRVTPTELVKNDK